MKHMVSFVGVLIFCVHSMAAVWTGQAPWTDAWESEYVNWIAEEVEGDFFKDLGRPYSRVPLDCADAHYALRAYFAKTNGLFFAVDEGRVSNLTTRYDHIRDSDERMAAFIRYLRDSYWTEDLVFQDTFPPAINDLKPGDLFMYKVGSSGNFTRHTYIIKNINPDGTFDVLYSTQANAANNGPLKRKQQYMFKKAPVNRGRDFQRWGFRRMKKPGDVATSHLSLAGASTQQYDWASSMSSAQFFRQVQQTVKTVSESPQMLLTRHFNGLCSTVNDRIEIVNEGLRHQQRLGGSCMNFRDYDAHSTPSRDSGIMSDYESYYLDMEDIEGQNRWAQVRQQTKYRTQMIFAASLNNTQERDMYQACPIDYGQSSGETLSTNLSFFRSDLFENLVSFHPNDNIHHRWGNPVGRKTRCEEFYGYPN